jgi:Bacteriophage Rz lysis protein
MALLLNWRIWAALVLCLGQAAFGWKMYKVGENSIQVKFDMYRNQQIQAAQQQESANRLKEQGMQKSLENLTNAYIKNQKANSASAAAAGNSLRDLQTAIDRPTPRDTCAPSSTNGATSRPEPQLLGSCAAALVRLAEEADRLEEQVIGLQAYIKEVVLK